jgi:nucleotide-binding universal stress UspA family protein
VKPDRDTVELVHVADLVTRDVMTTFLVDFDMQIIDKANDERIANAISLLRAFEAQFKAANVKCECVALVGDAKKVLVEESEKRHADMIVVGCRGLGAIKSFFIGSVSEYISRHAHCSVLIVK